MRKLNTAIAVMIVLGSLNTVSAQSSATPHVLVYKTKSHCKNLVPVVLSGDKKEVASYPDPTDVKRGSGYPLPLSLHKGYLLDRVGVGWNTAFIVLTYDEYSRLKAAPSTAELYKMVGNKNPLTELWDCGVRNADETELQTRQRVNKLIDKKLFKKKCTAVSK